MGVATRSCRRFDGDTIVPLKRTHAKVVRAQPKWTVAEKRVTHVLFARPAQETEMFITLPVTDAVHDALLQGGDKLAHTVHVVAWDPVTKCAYDRGAFVVARLQQTQVVLQKHLPHQRSPRTAKKSAPVQQAAPRSTAVTTRAPPTAAPTPPSTMWNTRVFLRPVTTAAPLSLPALPHTTQAARTPPPLTRTPPPLTRTPPTPTRTPPPLTRATPPPSTLIRAISTLYDGVQYRSRLEAKFARLLQLLNVRFVYEPVRHVRSGGGTYTIDFFLPDQQLYVELKPKRPHIEEEQRCEDMSAQGFRVALMYGSCLYKPPFRSELFNGRSHRDYAHHDALRGMCWVDGVKLVGETVFVAHSGSATQTPPSTTLQQPHINALAVPRADTPHLHQVVSPRDTRWAHPAILRAYQQLREEGSSLFT